MDFLERFYDHATDHWPEYVTLFLATLYYVPLLWRRYQNSRVEKDTARAKKLLEDITKAGYIERQRWLRDSFALRGLVLWALGSYLETLRFIYSLPPIQQKGRWRLAIAMLLLMICRIATFFLFVRSSSHHAQTDEVWLENQREKLAKIVDDYKNRPPKKPNH